MCFRCACPLTPRTLPTPGVPCSKYCGSSFKKGTWLANRAAHLVRFKNKPNKRSSPSWGPFPPHPNRLPAPRIQGSCGQTVGTFQKLPGGSGGRPVWKSGVLPAENRSGALGLLSHFSTGGGGGCGRRMPTLDRRWCHPKKKFSLFLTLFTVNISQGTFYLGSWHVGIKIASPCQSQGYSAGLTYGGRPSDLEKDLR